MCYKVILDFFRSEVLDGGVTRKKQADSDLGYKDPRWQMKRLEVFKRDESRCQLCFQANKELHCHHLAYKKGRPVWETPVCDLISLCVECHDEITRIKESIGKSISNPVWFRMYQGLEILTRDKSTALDTLQLVYSLSRYPKMVSPLAEIMANFTFPDVSRDLETGSFRYLSADSPTNEE